MSGLAAAPIRGGDAPRARARMRWALSVARRGVPADAPSWLRSLTVSGVVLGAVAVAASAVIHLHLWLQGYKHIHLIGPLFLAQSIAGIGLALVMVAYPRFVSAVMGALYMASTIAGLLVSATVGIFGFHDGLSVPWATSSLVIEVVGLVMLGAAGVVLFARR